MNVKKLKFLIFALFAVLILNSCNQNKFKVDVSKTPKPKVVISDYGSALFTVNRDSLDTELNKLQPEFPLFLGTEPLQDEQVIQLSMYIGDPFLNDLFLKYKEVFPSLQPLESQLETAFQHLKYYNPETEMPEVFAYISGVQDPVFFKDNVLVIGMDNFLGQDCEIYARMGIPKYKMRFMIPEAIVREVLNAIAEEKISAPAADASILEYMIYEGKKWYFIKSMFPEISDSLLMNFSEEQLAWFEKQEKALWKFYIENELLYKSDYESLRKYINEAPFTSVLGNDSPPRTGVWLGYQIVLAYADHSSSDLKTLLRTTNAQEVLNQSKYKPGR